MTLSMTFWGQWFVTSWLNVDLFSLKQWCEYAATLMIHSSICLIYMIMNHVQNETDPHAEQKATNVFCGWNYYTKKWANMHGVVLTDVELDTLFWHVCNGHIRLWSVTFIFGIQSKVAHVYLHREAQWHICRHCSISKEKIYNWVKSIIYTS